MRANAAERLLQHYVDNFRRLPWRTSPGEAAPDPYRVWLSEIMLQQTTVVAVTPRFERFVERWPTVGTLAAARDSDVLGEWAGLGYYARARNLIACARQVAERGGFPGSEADLLKLPGIGAYTAAAIAAIAFRQRAVVVDTNVKRVVARLHGLAAPIDRQLRAFADEMTPDEGAGDFAQAMMDLGATICTPRDPHCCKCPLRADCLAYATGSPADFPTPKAKRIRPKRYGVAEWIEEDGQVWLVRRAPSGLLGGMAALPGGDWAVDVVGATPIAAISHSFTHFTLDLAIVSGSEPAGDGWWQPIEDLDAAGLPTLYRKAAAAVLARDDRLAA